MQYDTRALLLAVEVLLADPEALGAVDCSSRTVTVMVSVRSLAVGGLADLGGQSAPLGGGERGADAAVQPPP
jgi:hypothetical protein